MHPVLDFTTRKDLGIRLRGTESCRVIRLMQGVWTEIGQEYALPVEATILAWTKADIPGSILAVALRIYELDHPGTDLRSVLTQNRSGDREGRLDHARPREHRHPHSGVPFKRAQKKAF